MIRESIAQILKHNNLEIKNNSYEDIFALYEGNVSFARMSNSFPITMKSIKEDVDTIPPFTSKEKKHYLSIYNEQEELVAVLDFIEEFSHQNKHGGNSIWIGLLQIDVRMQGTGIGRVITDAVFSSCRENKKNIIQLGVIKENINALQFWKKLGFNIFTEVNNGEVDLYLMEKDLV
jgi:ribosomal protein S18 acetylase RimI-like enzyme